MITSPPKIHARHHTISSWSLEALGSELAAWTSGIISSVTYAASTVIAVPFSVHAGFVVQKVGWANGTGAGNGTNELGVYTEDGVLLGSASANSGAVSAIASVALGSPLALPPGRYYMAILAGSALDSYFGYSTSIGPLEAVGVRNAANATGSLRGTETWAVPTQAKLPTIFIAGHTIY